MFCENLGLSSDDVYNLHNDFLRGLCLDFDHKVNIQKYGLCEEQIF